MMYQKKFVVDINNFVENQYSMVVVSLHIMSSFGNIIPESSTVIGFSWNFLMSKFKQNKGLSKTLEESKEELVCMHVEANAVQT